MSHCSFQAAQKIKSTKVQILGANRSGTFCQRCHTLYRCLHPRPTAGAKSNIRMCVCGCTQTSLVRHIRVHLIVDQRYPSCTQRHRLPFQSSAGSLIPPQKVWFLAARRTPHAARGSWVKGRRLITILPFSLMLRTITFERSRFREIPTFFYLHIPLIMCAGL